MANVSNKESSKKSPGVLEKIIDKRSVPGVVSLTGTKSLLYMNAEAEEICQQVSSGQDQSLNGSVGQGVSRENETMCNGALPQEIFDLCDALQQEPGSDNASTQGEEVQLRRVIGKSDYPILLRGFLVPGHEEHEPRFLILLEKLGRRPQAPSNEAKKHFNLTDRELEIIMNVAEGKTNRDIAKLLNISEHTVKEHIKHVFKKTGSSTRTGILAQIFRFS